VSPSISPSSSISPSLSPSSSNSPSVSPSSSPSVGYQDYTRGNYASLPTGILDLETIYSVGDIANVATKDDTRVGQTATGEYTIHQFKDYVASNSGTFELELQTNLAPASSTIYLQIFNRDTPAWETIDSDNTSNADTDFILTASKADLTNYKDTNNVVVCRVYQLGV
jgi:hypothetical protein